MEKSYSVFLFFSAHTSFFTLMVKLPIIVTISIHFWVEGDLNESHFLYTSVRYWNCFCLLPSHWPHFLRIPNYRFILLSSTFKFLLYFQIPQPHPTSCSPLLTPTHGTLSLHLLLCRPFVGISFALCNHGQRILPQPTVSEQCNRWNSNGEHKQISYWVAIEADTEKKKRCKQ